MSEEEYFRLRLRPGQRAELTRRALEAGYPDASSWVRALTGLGAEPLPKGPPRSEEAIEREARIRELAAAGKKSSEIAVEVERSVGWVRRVLKEAE